MSLPRFHVPEAAPGARLELPDHVAHHAREVLRLRPGAAVQVFDGQGNEYQATVERIDRRHVTVHLGSPLVPRPEGPLRIVLALSTLRGDGMEWVVQKATELGVAEIRPLVTARTDSAARPALLGTRQERWEKVASGAAEQCGRAVVPSVATTTHLDPFLAEAFEGARLIFDANGGAGLRSLSAPMAVQILIGPPGGWDPIELEHAVSAGFQAMSLGPRTLRTETAAITAIAALQALWSDLG